MATIAEGLFLNGSYPVRIDQSINTNKQVVSLTCTYSDSSKVYGAFTYADSVALDYLAAAYGSLVVAPPTPTANPNPTPTPTANPTPTPTATGYTLTTNAAKFVVNAPATITVTSVGGAFASGTIITPSVSGVAGTFSPTTLTANGNITFTPSGTGSAAITAANNQALPAPAALVKSVTIPRPVFTTSDGFATFTNGVISFPDAPSAVISNPIALADFGEVSFILNADSIPGRLIFELSTTATGWDPENGVAFNLYNAVRLRGQNTAVHIDIPPASTPVGTICRLKKKNTNDIEAAYSTDGVNFTVVTTVVGALASTIYVKVRKNESGDFGIPGSTKVYLLEPLFA